MIIIITIYRYKNVNITFVINVKSNVQNARTLYKNVHNVLIIIIFHHVVIVIIICVKIVATFARNAKVRIAHLITNVKIVINKLTVQYFVLNVSIQTNRNA